MILLPQIGWSTAPGRLNKALKELEVRLKRVSAAEEHQVMEECLDWIPAMEDEYKSLLQHGAIKPLSEAEYKKIKSGPEVLDVIPGLVAATVKAPNDRKKCREQRECHHRQHFGRRHRWDCAENFGVISSKEELDFGVGRRQNGVSTSGSS